MGMKKVLKEIPMRRILWEMESNAVTVNSGVTISR